MTQAHIHIQIGLPFTLFLQVCQHCIEAIQSQTWNLGRPDWLHAVMQSPHILTRGMSRHETHCKLMAIVTNQAGIHHNVMARAVQRSLVPAHCPFQHPGIAAGQDPIVISSQVASGCIVLHSQQPPYTANNGASPVHTCVLNSAMDPVSCHNVGKTGSVSVLCA